MLSLTAHRFVEELEARDGQATLAELEQALAGAGYQGDVVRRTVAALVDLNLIQVYNSSGPAGGQEVSIDRDRVERAYRDGQLARPWFSWTPPPAPVGPRSRLSPLAARRAQPAGGAPC